MTDSLENASIDWAMPCLIFAASGFLFSIIMAAYWVTNTSTYFFNSISPLAWLSLVTMVVSMLYVSLSLFVAKPFLHLMTTAILGCLLFTVVIHRIGTALKGSKAVELGIKKSRSKVFISKNTRVASFYFLSRLMVSVLAFGFIKFLLGRISLQLLRTLSWDKTDATR